ncbi:hypothetical protein GCM10020370_49370 [Paenibacillus hodogayensis]
MKLAYGRVSAKDQNPERQLIKFRELGVEERFIFVDKQRRERLQPASLPGNAHDDT